MKGRQPLFGLIRPVTVARRSMHGAGCWKKILNGAGLTEGSA
jgi:hypothetical protein